MLMDPALNIGGSEWLIIVLAAMILLLGTNKFPEAARKLGKIAGEFDKAKKEISRQVSEVGEIRPAGAVESEREKLDTMARTLGIAHKDVTDDELRKLIADKVGKRAES